MVPAERITIFGDITGIRADDIRTFVRATNHSYGGSYPGCQEDLANEEIVGSTRELLAEAGILDPFPIIPCRSAEERVRQILQNCRLRGMQNGAGFYWIIDRNPHSFVGAVKSVASEGNYQADILRSTTTIIKLGLGQAFDQFDPVTEIRLVALPPSIPPFPFHPTPAS